MITECFLLRSIDRTSTSTSSANFELNPVSLMGSYETQYVAMFNSPYPVNSTNNIIYFTENSTPKTATIVAGNYSTSGTNSILTAIGSVMTTASGGYATFTATISATTGLITITSTQNYSLTFATNTTSSAYKVLGYAVADTSSTTAQTGTRLPNLSGLVSIAINIKQAENSGFLTSLGYAGQLVVPLNASFGGFVFNTSNLFTQFLHFRQRASKLNITVSDLAGNAVDLLGTEFEILLRKIA